MNNLVSTVPNEKKQPREFVKYIHHFRGIAILFVVACHLLLDWGSGSKTYKILEILFGNGTVLFVFIAGYLFQHLTRKLDYKDYLKKKMTNVIIPYLLVSTPIIVYRIITGDLPGYITDPHPDFINWPVMEQVLYFLSHGAHMQQLWFVPMIALFYLSAPLFYYFDRHPKSYWLLVLFFGLSVLIDREPFSDIFKMFVHFISVYFFGMFMSRYKKEFLEFAKRYHLLITGSLIAVLLANYFYYDLFRNPLNYIQKMLFCAFFIYWLWRLEKYIPSFINELADISFGIFFLHYYSILVIKAIYQYVTKSSGIPGHFLYWLADYFLVLFATVIVIRMVRKIVPKYSRNLIGC